MNRFQASVQRVKNLQVTAILGRKESGLEFDPGSIAYNLYSIECCTTKKCIIHLLDQLLTGNYGNVDLETFERS